MARAIGYDYQLACFEETWFELAMLREPQAPLRLADSVAVAPPGGQGEPTSAE